MRNTPVQTNVIIRTGKTILRNIFFTAPQLQEYGTISFLQQVNSRL